MTLLIFLRVALLGKKELYKELLWGICLCKKGQYSSIQFLTISFFLISIHCHYSFQCFWAHLSYDHRYHQVGLIGAEILEHLTDSCSIRRWGFADSLTGFESASF